MRCLCFTPLMVTTILGWLSRSARLRSIPRWELAAPLAVGALPGTALAHERFVKHDMLRPFPHDFFFHVDGNTLNIAIRVALAMVAVLFLWFRRQSLQTLVETKLLRGSSRRSHAIVHFLLRFVTDQPLQQRWFKRVGEWSVILFLRCPALVLMFSAANSSLVMPTYPLSDPTKAFFQYAAVALGIAIITQLALPLCGIISFAIFGYICLAYDWKLAVDVLPVLTVAIIYVTLPWDSHLRPITSLTRHQMRLVRLVLGFSFFALGWMKIYNPADVIGIAQNFPTAMEDPLIKLFYWGTNPQLKEGYWLMAFALSEVLAGFLVMVGVFSRVWAVQLIFVFSKLMLVDFGWPEIPHLYPIGAFVLLAFSNQHSNELDGEPHTADEHGRWRPRWGVVTSMLASAAVALLVIFPVLYGLTLTERAFFRPPTAVSGARTAANTGGVTKIQTP
jgi:uncharacterized membrane protein YphA (DoxX/SURF4 family)